MKNFQIQKVIYEYSNNLKHDMDKLKYIFEIVNPKSTVYNKQILTNIKNKITPYELIYNKPWELYTEHWKDIVEEQNKNDKIVIDKTAEFTTTQFTCSNVKIMNVKLIHYKHVVLMNLQQFL